MKKLMNWLKNEESGQGLVEYGLILVFIAIGVIAVLQVLGPKITKIYSDVNNKLT